MYDGEAVEISGRNISFYVEKMTFNIIFEKNIVFARRNNMCKDSEKLKLIATQDNVRGNRRIYDYKNWLETDMKASIFDSVII